MTVDRTAVHRAERKLAVEVGGLVQDWISLAGALEPDLAAAKRSERAAILGRAAAERGYKTPTVRRMVRAYRYLLARAKAVGVSLDEVAAPLVSIEVLERIERANEVLEPDLRQSVLLGKVSFREMLKLERRLLETRRERQEKRAHDIRASPVDWLAFATELSEVLFGGGKLSFRFGADREAYSQPARDLAVDWEVTYDQKRIAIFLSPKIIFSEFRGKSILDQLPRAVMACFYFDTVVYIGWDRKELGLIGGYLEPAPAIMDLALEFACLSELLPAEVYAHVGRS